MKTNCKSQEKYPECYWCYKNTGAVSLWGNIGLLLLKVICGLEGNSKALLVDAVHSGVDVLTAAVVMICLHIGNTPPDSEHPYGHGNTEYIASLFIGLSLFGVVGFIIYQCVINIFTGFSADTVSKAAFKFLDIKSVELFNCPILRVVLSGFTAQTT